MGGGLNHHLGPVCLNQIAVGLGQFLVRDHHVKLFQRREVRCFDGIEFGVVGQQHAVLGLAQDLLFDLNFVEVETGHAQGLADACG